MNYGKDIFRGCGRKPDRHVKYDKVIGLYLFDQNDSELPYAYNAPLKETERSGWFGWFGVIWVTPATFKRRQRLNHARSPSSNYSVNQTLA